MIDWRTPVWSTLSRSGSNVWCRKRSGAFRSCVGDTPCQWCRSPSCLPAAFRCIWRPARVHTRALLAPRTSVAARVPLIDKDETVTHCKVAMTPARAHGNRRHSGRAIRHCSVVTPFFHCCAHVQCSERWEREPSLPLQSGLKPGFRQNEKLHLEEVCQVFRHALVKPFGTSSSANVFISNRVIISCLMGNISLTWWCCVESARLALPGSLFARICSGSAFAARRVM